MLRGSSRHVLSTNGGNTPVNFFLWAVSIALAVSVIAHLVKEAWQ